jgi:hypothetical protein
MTLNHRILNSTCTYPDICSHLIPNIRLALENANHRMGPLATIS